MPRVRIVGCGNPDAGDDAAGLVAVDRARPLVPSDVEVVTAPTALHVLDLLEGADTVLLVDAMRTTAGGRDPGEVVRAESGPDGFPVALRSSLSSHGLGLAEAVGLAAALGPVPQRRVPGRRGRRRARRPGPVAGGGGGAARARRGDRPRGRRRNGDRMMRPEAEARRISVRGVVQGVGFRPFVWRLAERHGLTGWVRNADGVVEIHLEGPPASLDAFVEEIGGSPPPLALVEDVSWTPEDVQGFPGFDVDASVEGAAGDRLVPPDAATCDACLRELFDPDDRRYRYPFINCTDCGPRFTIIESLPYDRARTSMRDFPMCEACRQEYEDPGDRRFHAEPVACPGLRSAGRAPRRVGRPCRRRCRGPRRLDAPRRGDRGDQGARRVPPGVRRDRCGGRAAAPRAEAAPGQAVRGDGGRPRGGARVVRADGGGGGRALVVARPDRPGAPIAAGWRPASRRAIAAAVRCCPRRRCTTCCSARSRARS